MFGKLKTASVDTTCIDFPLCSCGGQPGYRQMPASLSLATLATNS